MKQLLIVILVMLSVVSLSTACRKKRREEGVKVRERYHQAAIEHLEQKYGEEFVVYEDLSSEETVGFGFPGTLWSFTAYAKSDESYLFYVYIRQEQDSNDIKELFDGYYWKFLRPQLKAYIQQGLEDLDIEYKMFIHLGSHLYFSNHLTQTSTLEEFLQSEEYMVAIISLYLPLPEEGQIEVLTERCRELAYGLITKNGDLDGCGIDIWNLNDRSQYDLIDESVDSQSEEKKFFATGKPQISPRIYPNPFWETGRWKDQYAVRVLSEDFDVSKDIWERK